jgi:general secretion pathway protein N
VTLRRVLLALAFASVFIAGLLVFAPASLMGYGLERASGGALSLVQTQGSIWRGSGVALLRQNSRYQTLGSYRWQLQILSASVQVQAGDATVMSARYVPFAQRVDVDNLHISFPVSAIDIVAPQLAPYQLRGSLTASSDHLTLDAAGMHGQVTVDWLQAASALSDIRPLGDYRILLQSNGRSLDAQLSTLSGKLKLDGKGSFDNAAGMRFNGTAQATPGTAQAEVTELLHHIGPEVRPGIFALDLMPQSSAAR